MRRNLAGDCACVHTTRRTLLGGKERAEEDKEEEGVQALERGANLEWQGQCYVVEEIAGEARADGRGGL